MVDQERFKSALVRFVRDAVPTTFLRIVRARVVAVDGASVDTDPETPGTPQLTGLQPRYGLPGVLRAVCRAGARAVVAWAEGDPAQPYVAGWDPGVLEELVFDVPEGAEPLGRDGDTVSDGAVTIAAVPVPGSPPTTTVNITYTPPGAGAPAVLSINGLPPGVTASGTWALTGLLNGTSRVKA